MPADPPPRYGGVPAFRLRAPGHGAGSTGNRWPRRHGLMTDYRHQRIGDPKWIWELNRLQHVPLLLAAWLVTGDDALAEAAIADLLGWIELDTPGYGIPWANAFE